MADVNKTEKVQLHAPDLGELRVGKGLALIKRLSGAGRFMKKDVHKVK